MGKKISQRRNKIGEDKKENSVDSDEPPPNKKGFIDSARKSRANFNLRGRVYFLSNYPPYECGIATFTQDLVRAVNKVSAPSLQAKVVALTDFGAFHEYPRDVRTEVDRDDKKDLVRKAKMINQDKGARVVCIQHEFGLYGGRWGDKLLYFLRYLEKPVITAFHTVLPKPKRKARKIAKILCQKSKAVIVMTRTAKKILSERYGVDEEKIYVVPHGIHDVPFQNNYFYKKRHGLQNRIVLSTFGLLSKGKGIEYVLKAMKKLARKYPKILYLVLGATHPRIKAKQGEKYRSKLMRKVKKWGLENNVKFYDKYLDLKELIDYILASDVYIFTNLDKKQMVSGTLAYAVGCGRCVVATPIPHAKEILNEGRGVLVDFKKPKSFVKAIDKVLQNRTERSKIEKRAYDHSRQMIWSEVSRKYLRIFDEVCG